LSDYRPLSSRGQPAERFDGPQTGIPPYLRDPVAGWVEKRIHVYHSNSGWTLKRQTIEKMQVALRLQQPFEMTRGPSGLLENVLGRVRGDQELALNVIDYLLHFVASDRAAGELSDLLTLGGSEWEVSPTEESPDGKWQLTRRAIGPVKPSIDEIRTDSQRAHHHLEIAWSKLVGRSPDPSTAYRESIRAVESVAKPVVSPNNARATLGTMIADLRNKPTKWEVSLDSATVDDVANLAGMIWTSQLDRHGTDDEEVPLTVSQKEADAAFYISLALVRFFAGGHISPS
jgi:hypothetical protein